MTSFWLGLLLFLIALAAAHLGDLLLKLPESVGRTATAIALLASVGCSGLGLFHALNDWGLVDLMGRAESGDHPVTGKRAIALSLVMIWPLVMVAVGLLGTFLYARTLGQFASRR